MNGEDLSENQEKSDDDGDDEASKQSGWLVSDGYLSVEEICCSGDENEETKDRLLKEHETRRSRLKQLTSN